MNPDRAAQYLEEGLPDLGGDDNAMPGQPVNSEPSPTTWAELAASTRFQREVEGVRDQASLQVSRELPTPSAT